MTDLAVTCAHFAGDQTEYPCRKCGDSGYELTREGYEMQGFFLALQGSPEFKRKALGFVEDIMAKVDTFESRARRAIQNKLNVRSSVFEANLEALSFAGDSGSDAVLKELLNSSVAGAGIQPFGEQLVGSASQEEKRGAIEELEGTLLHLLMNDFKTRLISGPVSDLLDKLKGLPV
jgi:hypothetical protein